MALLSSPCSSSHSLPSVSFSSPSHPPSCRLYSFAFGRIQFSGPSSSRRQRPITASQLCSTLDTSPIDTSSLNVAEAFSQDELWAAACLRVRSFYEFRPDAYGVHDHRRSLAEREFEALKERVSGKREGFRRVSCINATLPLSQISSFSDDLCDACKFSDNGEDRVVVGTLDLNQCLRLPDEITGLRPEVFDQILVLTFWIVCTALHPWVGWAFTQVWKFSTPCPWWLANRQRKRMKFSFMEVFTGLKMNLTNCWIPTKWKEICQTGSNFSGSSIVCIDWSMHHMRSSPHVTQGAEVGIGADFARAYLSNVCVAKEMHRNGLGHLLVTKSKIVAQDWGITDLYVHVAVDNEPAKKLYMKSGFIYENDEPAWQARFLDRPRRLLLWNGLPGMDP
ncbi:hypothetical protein CJ030_MR8G028261 [Morella rubra]|uniref:N-acetyltransferase domain-containing protein n=1 Tax=Morella rubra TaxID=262757 RepID=A0A6A1UYM7_9ROSI|nr:hypothetical protein CJ030_MR8G028261 [Morella rubra]